MDEFKLKRANETYLKGNDQLVEYRLDHPEELGGRKIENVRLYGFPEKVADLFRVIECGEKLQPVETLDTITLEILRQLPDHLKKVIGIE